MNKETQLMLAGLQDLFARELTDEEVTGVEVWNKCRDMERFLMTFPNEWAMFKEMLQTYVGDARGEWIDSISTKPSEVGNLIALHAQAHAIEMVISSFIQDVENAPTAAKQVPEPVKQGYAQLKAQPPKQ